jgi:hypothetical protein
VKGGLAEHYGKIVDETAGMNRCGPKRIDRLTWARMLRDGARLETAW